MMGKGRNRVAHTHCHARVGPRNRLNRGCAFFQDAGLPRASKDAEKTRRKTLLSSKPLTRRDVTDKFALNAAHGGWTSAQSDAALKLMAGFYNGRIDLASLRG